MNVVIEEVTEEAGLDELNMNKKVRLSLRIYFCTGHRLSSTLSFYCTLPRPQVCSVYGDPHFSTFDGFTYDYMGTFKI